jgi:hypothetical protein
VFPCRRRADQSAARGVGAEVAAIRRAPAAALEPGSCASTADARAPGAQRQARVVSG